MTSHVQLVLGQKKDQEEPFHGRITLFENSEGEGDSRNEELNRNERKLTST